MKTCLNPTSRLLRWALKLQEFSFNISYTKGGDNAADGLQNQSKINK